MLDENASKHLMINSGTLRIKDTLILFHFAQMRILSPQILNIIADAIRCSHANWNDVGVLGEESGKFL